MGLTFQQAAIIATISGVLGATIAILGGHWTESLRQGGEARRWRLDKKLGMYIGVLEASRDARYNSYEAREFGEELDWRYNERFRDLLVQAELLASEEALRAMKVVRDAMNSDFHAARDPKDVANDVRFKKHHGDAAPPWSSYEEWHRLRNKMVNVLRKDLGIEQADLIFMRPRLASEA